MSNRLEAVRREQGLPQRAIAVRSGVSLSTISAIERWSYRPAPQTCERIAAALGVSVGDIWPGLLEEVDREPAAA